MGETQRDTAHNRNHHMARLHDGKGTSIAAADPTKAHARCLQFQSKGAGKSQLILSQEWRRWKHALSSDCLTYEACWERGAKVPSLMPELREQVKRRLPKFPRSCPAANVPSPFCSAGSQERGVRHAGSELHILGQIRPHALS